MSRRLLQWLLLFPNYNLRSLQLTKFALEPFYLKMVAIICLSHHPCKSSCIQLHIIQFWMHCNYSLAIRRQMYQCQSYFQNIASRLSSFETNIILVMSSIDSLGKRMLPVIKCFIDINCYIRIFWKLIFCKIGLVINRFCIQCYSHLF